MFSKLALAGFLLLPGVAGATVFEIDEHFPHPPFVAPPGDITVLMGSRGWWLNGPYTVWSACCGNLQMHTLGTDVQSQWHRSDDFARPWTWGLEFRLVIESSEGPWATNFLIENDRFRLELGINPANGTIAVGGLGEISLAGEYRGPVWHTYRLTGDGTDKWRLYVNGVAISYQGNVLIDYPAWNQHRTTGVLAFGDGTPGQDAYWTLDRYHYTSSIPEPSSLILVGGACLVIARMVKTAHPARKQ
ncbi:MAG: hypothetical protein FJW40_10725 [Acidobacteria bacterium]|nr:hypothetical protein [Acidobacteriota bacterium]